MVTLWRTSPRRDKYDYGSPWTYFVTICTHERKHLFGEIKKGIMCLNNIGKIVDESITLLPEIRKTIILFERMVMPNHIHLLFHMSANNIPLVGAGIHQPEWADAHPYGLARGQTLSSVIGNFKAMITRKCNQQSLPFTRQRSYHDRILRDQREFDVIKYYIQTNPQRRENDCFYTHG